MSTTTASETAIYRRHVQAACQERRMWRAYRIWRPWETWKTWSERGQATLEAAVVFPVLVMVAVGLVQFALYYHAQNVVTVAVHDGARVAAAENSTLSDGLSYARTLLRAGLGQTADEITLVGRDGGDAVAIEAIGRLHTIIPWVSDSTLPLSARAVAGKERFRGRGGP